MPRASDPVYPEHFTAAGGKTWKCDICIGRNGGTGRAMTRKQVAYHELSSKHSSKVAVRFFRYPKAFNYVGCGKWNCGICKKKGMGVTKARAHEFQCQGMRPMRAAENEEAESMHGFLDRPRRSEGNDGTTSTHQEGTVFERYEDDEADGNEDDNEDDNNNDNNNDDNNDDAAFIENFLRSQDVDASYRERMRIFYELPTDQKIQKIREVIEVIRDLYGQ